MLLEAQEGSTGKQVANAKDVSASPKGEARNVKNDAKACKIHVLSEVCLLVSLLVEGRLLAR